MHLGGAFCRGVPAGLIVLLQRFDMALNLDIGT